MTTVGKPRAKGAELPSWWMSKVRELVDERKQTLGENLTELGERLAESVGRSRKWDHSAVSRFLNEDVTTVPMAEAFSVLFGIPRPIFMPRSFDEALSLQQVSRRYDGPPATPERSARVASMDRALAVNEEQLEYQTSAVRSQNEGAHRGRRSRRATRRRPTAS